MSLEYLNLISIENLFQAWSEFKKGKRKRPDVQKFERHLEDNLFNLHYILSNKTYRHGGYHSFYVQDPKRRHIHKASINDRIVHHLLYRFLCELFDKTFIYDSYSCRLTKGTHKAVDRLEKFTRRVSKNYTKPCWALKCDIKKFFAGVDHEILLRLLKKRIKDEDILWLLSQIIESFHSEFGKGIPLGNLTSQIFANIYLNELDHFIKNELRMKHYLRYADDFLILDCHPAPLYQYIDTLKQFLADRLKLELHLEKIIFRRLDWGIDFLGYVVLPYYRLLRTRTKRRIFKRMKSKIEDFRNGKTTPFSLNQSLQSYLGFFKHANAYELSQKLKNQIWFWAATMDESFYLSEGKQVLGNIGNETRN